MFGQCFPLVGNRQWKSSNNWKTTQHISSMNNWFDHNQTLINLQFDIESRLSWRTFRQASASFRDQRAISDCWCYFSSWASFALPECHKPTPLAAAGRNC